MSKWSEIYKQQISEYGSLEDYINHRINYKIKLINIVKKYSDINKTIMEIGCGSGITSAYLGNLGYKVTGIDSDPDMIKLADSINNQSNKPVIFKLDDILTLNHINSYFDVIFSNGVMEHFNDSEIISAINRQILLCNYLVISIPSNYFSDSQKIYGNERFMTPGKWSSIISQTNCSIIEEFNFNSEENKFTSTPQFIGFVLKKVII